MQALLAGPRTPVPAARVEVIEPTSAADEVKVTLLSTRETDGEGVALFELAGADRIDVFATAEIDGRPLYATKRRCAIVAGGRVGLEMILAPATSATIIGCVRDRDSDAAVSGAIVRSDCQSGSTSTNLFGRFEMIVLGPNRGTIPLWIDAPGYAREYASAHASAPDRGEPATYYVRRSGSVRGVVIDAAGNPKAGADVRAHASGAGFDVMPVPFVETDDKGRFVFARLPSRVPIAIDAHYDGRTTVTRVEGIVLEQGETREVVLRSRSSVELSGRVLDAYGGPVRGGMIEARIDTLHDDARIRSDGTYYLPFLGSGKGWIQATVGQDDADVPGSVRVEFEIPEGLNEWTFDVQLARTQAIAGRLVDFQGLPVDLGTVMLIASSFETVSATVDSAGVFRFENVGAGEYKLRGYSPQQFVQTEELGVRAGDVGLELRLPATGTIRGRVVDAAHSAPIVEITLSGSRMTSPRSIRMSGEGLFVLDLVPIGVASLSARSGDMRSALATVTVKTGRESTAPDLVLETSTRLRLVAGRAAPGATFEIRRGDVVHGAGTLSADEERVLDVPTGRLRVVVRAAGRRDEEHSVEALADAEAVVLVLRDP